MKYLYLVWAALRRKPVRTFLTLLSVTTAFFLFGVLQGINLGIEGVFKMLNTAHLRVMSRVNMNDPMPISHARRMAAIPGVAHVTGLTVVFGSYQQPRNIQIALAVDIDETFQIYETMKVQPQVLAAMRRTRSGAIVGRALARKYGWKVGDRIPIHAFNVTRKDGSADWVFDIVGFYDMEQSEWASNMWVHYDYVNEARGAGKDTAMQFMVGINDARQAAKISQAIDDAFANSPAQTTTQNEKDFVESLLRQIGDISFLVNGIVGAVLFTLLFLTANTMAQSVRERIPELAVLKTVGFSDNTVQWLVLAESLALSILAALLGLGIAALVLPAMTSVLQAQGGGAMHVRPLVVAVGAGVAVLLAIVSGILPARRARRLDIVAALAGR
ncbi:MAG TPA: ABC transporter permease [Steroidobacteraceae bacterium]|nr:ABC transporter permease [Steroidobacteraceae bacterium]